MTEPMIEETEADDVETLSKDLSERRWIGTA